MFLVITISISALVLLLLFISKKLGKNFFTKLDPKSEKFISILKFRVKQIVQTTKYIVFVVIPQRSEVSFKKGKDAAMREYNKQKEAVMGKKDLTSGGASFFLKKMKEEMKTVKSGKIEDESLLE
jgi:hypothetical protein